MDANSVQQFLAMGGYADFIWPAYGLGFVCLVGLLWTSYAKMRQAERHLADLRAHRRDGAPQTPETTQ